MEISPDDYDAVFYLGGHGPLWGLSNNAVSINLIETMYAEGKPVAAVCHAPAPYYCRIYLRIINPWYREGKLVTGFSNTEEVAVQLTQIVPFLLEGSLKAKEADYTKVEDWQSYVVTDGNLVTGQNPASSEATVNAVLELLKSQTLN